MSEIWVKVLGYEDLYEVSNFGNVKSLDGFFSNQYTAWPQQYIRLLIIEIGSVYANINYSPLKITT